MGSAHSGRGLVVKVLQVETWLAARCRRQQGTAVVCTGKNAGRAQIKKQTKKYYVV
jgi:hypothetical protein